MLLGVFCLSLFSTPVLAQTESVEQLKKEIEALKQGQREIQKQLDEIKALLRSRQRPAPPQNVVLDIGDSAYLGDPNAKLTLVEFTDYQ